MKKLFTLFAILSLGVIACKKEKANPDPINSSSVVGNWTAVSARVDFYFKGNVVRTFSYRIASDSAHYYDLKQDGTGQLIYKRAVDKSFNYKIENNNLVLSEVFYPLYGIYGRDEYHKIDKLSKSEFIFQVEETGEGSIDNKRFDTFIETQTYRR